MFGEATNLRHKEWLIRRIAWRIPALAEGDPSQRARQRAAELANDADVRAARCMSPRCPWDSAPEASRNRGNERIKERYRMVDGNPGAGTTVLAGWSRFQGLDQTVYLKIEDGHSTARLLAVGVDGER